jgi:hypothetical protein
MRDLVFSVVVVLGALAVMQVSVDPAWAVKKPSHEKHEKHAKKEKKEKKKEKKEDEDKKDEKEKKDEKDRRETNKCPGWLSKGCSPGACRCPVGPDEKEQKETAEKAKKKAEEIAKKLKKAKGKEKKPQKAESGRTTQTRNGAEPARRMRSSSSPLSSFAIRYDKGADVLDNISLLPLPPRSPELNSQENVWQFLRQNWLSNRTFKSFDDIVDHCCYAWNTLIGQPWKIMRDATGRPSITHREDWYKHV